MVGDLARALQEADKELSTELNGQPLRFSSLDKPLWPSVSKRDLLGYLLAVAPTLLRYLHDRPVSMVRYPDGIRGPRVFQRHWTKGLPDFVETVSIYSESNHGPVPFVLVNNLATLLWLGQMSVLEIHPWHSRITPGDDPVGVGVEFGDSESFDRSVLNYPDYLVCDLDPNFPGEFGRVVSVAMAARQVFEDEGRASFVKTSGKRGLHVYVPLTRRESFDVVREQAETVGKRLMKEQGDVTLEPSLDKRPNKVFFDYSINAQSKTLACAYSPRGVEWAGVSFPIDWKALSHIDPKEFTVLTTPKRLADRGDAWEALLAEPVGTPSSEGSSKARRKA